MTVLIIFAVLVGILGKITRELSSQRIAERWVNEGGTSYSQLSIFYDRSEYIDLDQIYTMRVDIDKKLTENSIIAENESARIWLDSYSTETEMTVYSPRTDYTTSADTVVTATGGDYFMFHPLKLLSGAYYTDDDFMKDRVILDRNLAWQLFGSNDIVGMTVLVNNSRYYIAAVVDVESDDSSSMVYGEKPRMYMQYSAYKNMPSEGHVPITTYEVCLPNTVKGLAESIVKDTVIGEENCHKILENSARYTLKNLFAVAFDGGKRVVDNSTIYYPYWENAARINEEKAAGVLVAGAAMLIIPLITILYFVGLVIHKRKEIIRKGIEKVRQIFYNLKREKVTNKNITEGGH